MAGAAGGALQAAQRIGSAIGAAVLVTIYYQVLTGHGHDYSTAVSDALLAGSAFTLLALLRHLSRWHDVAEVRDSILNGRIAMNRDRWRLLTWVATERART
jgi:hypothetical protein